MRTPLISVVMPVYNRASFLENSIESILTQTFADFEFIIVNDGSSDNSAEIIRSYHDRRIVYLENPYNIGNYPSRNRGHTFSRGKYICVMDSDDIAEANRLESQFGYLEDNLNVGIAGSNCLEMPYLVTSDLPLTYEAIKVGLITRNRVFYHPTLMMRKSMLDTFKLTYDENYLFAGDGDLYMRASQYFPVINIEKPLLRYRVHNDNITNRHSRLQRFMAKEIAGSFLSVLNIFPTPDEKRIHFAIMWRQRIDPEWIPAVYEWVDKIEKANDKQDFFDRKLLRDAYQNYIDRYINNSPTHGKER